MLSEKIAEGYIQYNAVSYSLKTVLCIVYGYIYVYSSKYKNICRNNECQI